MSQVLRSTVGLADATGRCTQQRIFWCKNTSQWLLLLVLGSDLTRLRVLYNASPDFTLGTWLEATGSPYLFANAESVGASMNPAFKGAFGSHLVACYRDVGGNDVFHVSYFTDDGLGQYNPTHIRMRATAPGSVAVDSDRAVSTTNSITGTVLPLGHGICMTYFNVKPSMFYGGGNGLAFGLQWFNPDLGASWNDDPASVIASSVSPGYTNQVNHMASFPIGNTAYGLWENPDSFADPNSMDQVHGGQVGGMGKNSAGFTALLAGASPNDFGACAEYYGGYARGAPGANSRIHCVTRTGTNTYAHRINTSITSHTWIAGAAIPAQTSKAGAGLFMATPGSGPFVYLFVIDSDAANTVRYIKYNIVAGTWDAAWSALETSTKVRANIAGYAEDFSVSGHAAVIWTEQNGSDWDVAGQSLLVLPSHMPPSPGRFATTSYGRF